ncbi:MAG TPA: TraB/GumN family protein [Candidatus Obscuribacterales bacterium]
MWKATRGKDTVYLLGTIHGAKFDFYPLPVEMDQAFERSRHLVLEVVIDRVDVEKLKPAVEAISYYKPPDKLSLHLSEETKRVMEEYLRWSGESWALYEKYRPWLVVEMLAGSRRWRGESFKGSLGIDRYLLSRARNLGKAVSELETAEFQSTLFKNLSDKVQDKLLQVTIKHLKDMDEETKAVVKAWKNGDVDMLESYSRDAKKDPDLAPYDKVLLDDRNIGMAAKLEQLLKTKPGPHFVAVGAAHMVGETGLPNLLKKQGFSVEQITAKPAGTEPSAEKLVKRRFPREGFSIWLPGQPKRSASLIQSIDTVSFEFNEIPDGIYYIQCITIPVDESKLSIPGPLLLDKLVAECTRKYNVIGRKTISIEGNPGREADYVPKTPRDIPAGLGKEDIGARLRAVLVGRKVFMLLAVGKKPWLKCSHVNQFMDSLELAK